MNARSKITFFIYNPYNIIVIFKPILSFNGHSINKKINSASGHIDRRLHKVATMESSM